MARTVSKIRASPFQFGYPVLDQLPPALVRRFFPPYLYPISREVILLSVNRSDRFQTLNEQFKTGVLKTCLRLVCEISFANRDQPFTPGPDLAERF